MPYYNNIAYPVDYFSSYYSGFATFTTFRLNDTLSYTTPSFSGFQFSAATSKDNGANNESRNQFTASYTNNGFSFAAGIDDIGGADDTKIIGLSASYDNGPWYFATKYERFKSALEGSGWAADGTNVFNALVQYTTGKNTLRIMLADSDNYGEFILHAALDVQYSDKITLFLEYYQEQETAAISDRKQTTSYGSNSAPSDSGGRSFVTGIRYDF
jgi:predicted porin